MRDGVDVGVGEALLGLLSAGPAHGYQLRTAFEDATGGAWPLNVGQVYTTLQRLERDGLVALDHEDGERRSYRLSDAGRAHLDAWLDTAAPTPGGGRDETTMRVLLAITIEGRDPLAVIEHQRTALTARLQRHTREKAAIATDDVTRLLQLDRLILRCRADLDWLDHAEERLGEHRE